ncbi:hypothetical protein [Roseibium sp.]|uniref:hypothetical protein n=1 Tax=Roseibium sp. TaxID=1936156 RepID=UPI003B51477F
MTALRILLISFAAMVLALVFANVLPAPHHHMAGAFILPLFAIMLLALIAVRRRQGKDRAGAQDCYRTHRDGALAGSTIDGAGPDAG